MLICFLHLSARKGVLTIIILFIVMALACRTPHLMQTEFDGHLLKANESVYTDKPLKTLLKDIKPPIKMVWAFGERQAHGAPSYFVFWFHNIEEITEWRKLGKMPPRLRVYVKEPFEWHTESKTQPEQMKWTKRDLKKFGNLTVAYLRYSNGSL